MESEHAQYLLESTSDLRTEPVAGKEKGFTEEEVRREADRCMHCDCRKVDDCRLRILSDRYLAQQRRYWNADRKTISKSMQHELVIYEPGKCIKCSVCVRLTEKHGEKIGLTFIGRGFDVEIGVPLNDSLSDALKHTAELVAEACPTGALALKKEHK
jgi:NADH dehydrogenase/NADH:ubiquinone oxidoreductase subunit G